MKILIVLLSLTNFAVAQNSGTTRMTPEMVQQTTCTEKFKGLPDVARKLHVQPSKATGDIMLSMCDGRNYSLIELMNAFIDKMNEKYSK